MSKTGAVSERDVEMFFSQPHMGIFRKKFTLEELRSAMLNHHGRFEEAEEFFAVALYEQDIRMDTPIFPDCDGGKFAVVEQFIIDNNISEDIQPYLDKYEIWREFKIDAYCIEYMDRAFYVSG